MRVHNLQGNFVGRYAQEMTRAEAGGHTGGGAALLSSLGDLSMNGEQKLDAPQNTLSLVLMWPGPAGILPTEFLTMVLASIAICIAVAALSYWLSPLIFGEIFASLQDNKKLLWHTTAVAVVPAIVVPALAFEDVSALVYRVLFAYDPLTELYLAPTISTWRACGFSLGYMGFDTATMIIFSPQMWKELKPEMFHQLLLHHLFSILMWPRALLWGIDVSFVIYCMATEISSLSVHLRWFFVVSNSMESIWYLLISWSVVGAHTVVRVLPAPWIIYVFATSSYDRFTWLQLILTCVFVPVPLMLNLYWYYLVMMGVVRHLRGDLPDEVAEDTDGKETGEPQESEPATLDTAVPTSVIEKQ